jgi:hypothetical protein
MVCRVSSAAFAPSRSRSPVAHLPSKPTASPNPQIVTVAGQARCRACRTSRKIGRSQLANGTSMSAGSAVGDSAAQDLVE